jgi:hypothetical protein
MHVWRTGSEKELTLFPFIQQENIAAIQYHRSG